MNILEVEGLCKTYPAFALRDVSFAVEPGTIMGFIGRNGAGKSTTIKSMLNLVHPDSGRVTMFGQDFYANEPRRPPPKSPASSSPPPSSSSSAWCSAVWIFTRIRSCAASRT